MSAAAPTPISVTNGIFPPEKAESFEVGAKFSFLQDALGVGVSAFSIKKDNALTTDSTGTEVISGDAQKVQGFELSLSGQVTQDWSVYGGYTYLDAKTTDSTTPAAIGSRLQNTPKHAASLWTTYKPLPELTLGGGLTYRSRVFANTTETSSARPFVSVDALVSYDFGKFTVSLNANNLFNRLNYSAIWGSRVMPAPKRTFLVTAAVNF